MTHAQFPGLVTVESYVLAGSRSAWWRRLLGLHARPCTSLLFCSNWSFRAAVEMDVGASEEEWLAVALSDPSTDRQGVEVAKVLAIIPSANVRGFVAMETAPPGAWDLNTGSLAR